MLELVGVGHTVPSSTGERWLYRDLDLAFARQGLCAIIGPNGAGKSTLLGQLVGIEAPTTGEVRLGGRPVTTVPAAERARTVAFLPQHIPLYFDLPVWDVVMLGRAPHLGRLAPPGPEDRAKVEAALGEVSLGSMAARGVLTLSGGERQRVMLARMLATETPLLVLDEPTTALDIGHALGFLELCRRLAAEGRSVIVALHELELARRYADHALLLAGDGTATFGETSEIMRPDRLADVFGVRVTDDDGLRFYPAR